MPNIYNSTELSRLEAVKALSQRSGAIYVTDQNGAVHDIDDLISDLQADDEGADSDPYTYGATDAEVLVYAGGYLRWTLYTTR